MKLTKPNTCNGRGIAMLNCVSANSVPSLVPKFIAIIVIFSGEFAASNCETKERFFFQISDADAI